MSITQNPEQLSAPTPSTVRERWKRGELRHITNLGSFLIDSMQMERDRQIVKALQVAYGVDAVVQGNALNAEKNPDGLPDQTGVYVDARKWAELNPTQQ